MRPLEIVVILLVALWMAWPLLFGLRRPWGHLVAVAAGVVTVAHLVVERWRWQMVPVYVVVLIVSILAVWDWYDATSVPTPRSLRSLAYLAGGLVGVAALAVLPAAFPVFSFPEPAGPYEVGTVTLHLIDPARTEAYGPEPGGPREVMLQVWYPAAADDDALRARWSPDVAEVGPALARNFGLPGFFFDHARLVDSHAFTAAPMAEGGPWPVIVYSHGWTGFRTVNIDQSESLASHGFVVAAVDHTYGAIATVFPDGRVAGVDRAALPEEDSVTPEEYAERSRRLVATFEADLGFVVDQLGVLNGDGGDLAGAAVDGDAAIFSGRLDTERLGLFGHSTGGGAVVAFCHDDARCSAGLGLDAWVEPVSDAVIADGLTAPFLFMRSEEWTGDANDGRLRAMIDDGTAPAYLVSVEGSGHYDFTVSPLFSPLASWIGLKGPIDGERMVGIIDDYLVGFFTTYLADRPDPVLTSEPAFSEVTFEIVR